MPNWCYTSYVIESDKAQIQSFRDKLDELSQMEKPLIDNGFGNLWMGIIVNLLGDDWHTVRCRGQIYDYYIDDDGTLRLNVESAWSELDEVRTLFLKKFPDADVYYQTEEPGMGIFETNDSAGKYFTSRYVIDSEIGDGPEYFDTIEETAVYVQDLIGITTEPTSEGIRNAIAGWIEEDPEERWMCFNEFDVVE